MVARIGPSDTGWGQVRLFTENSLTLLRLDAAHGLEIPFPPIFHPLALFSAPPDNPPARKDSPTIVHDTCKLCWWFTKYALLVAIAAAVGAGPTTTTTPTRRFAFEFRPSSPNTIAICASMSVPLIWSKAKASKSAASRFPIRKSRASNPSWRTSTRSFSPATPS